MGSRTHEVSTGRQEKKLQQQKKRQMNQLPDAMNMQMSLHGKKEVREKKDISPHFL